MQSFPVRRVAFPRRRFSLAFPEKRSLSFEYFQRDGIGLQRKLKCRSDSQRSVRMGYRMPLTECETWRVAKSGIALNSFQNVPTFRCLPFTEPNRKSKHRERIRNSKQSSNSMATIISRRTFKCDRTACRWLHPSRSYAQLFSNDLCQSSLYFHRRRLRIYPTECRLDSMPT